MRKVLLLLVATAPLSSGYAYTIAGSGTDLTSLTTREEIHARLGKPVVTRMEAKGGMEAKHGAYCEEFRTRRKIAEPHTLRCFGPGYAMGLVMTGGALELFCV